MHPALKRTVEGLPRGGAAHVRKASDFSVRHLGPLRRRSGESYADHCHAVAETVREISEDPSILAAAMLHDLPLHPEGRALLRQAPLSESEKKLVRKMHDLRRLHIHADTKDLDRALEAFASDSRVLPLRMGHRLHDIRRIGDFPKKVQQQIGSETLHMYCAIAGRLSLHAWRHEMEDICFRVVQPEAAASLERQFHLYEDNDRRCMAHVRSLLLRKLSASGIESEIDGRTKSLYSTYRKMVVKQRRFEELTDRLAVRIVVKTVDECYRTLGIVHACLHPIPGKLKDYIGAPKENGYRSIHTVVYPLAGVSEYPVEIQIRTREMHQECEYGSAHHADYKHSLYSFRAQHARVDLFRNLFILRETHHTPEQFEHALRTYFDESRIGLFDEKNTLYHLPTPVTALDFCCHTAGEKLPLLTSVRVNGRAAPLHAVLSEGDTVEASFGSERALRKTWLHACKQRSSKRLLKQLLAA